MTDMAKLNRSIKAFLKRHEGQEKAIEDAITNLEYANGGGSEGIAKSFGARYVGSLMRLESYRTTPEEGVELALAELVEQFDEKEDEEECQACQL